MNSSEKWLENSVKLFRLPSPPGQLTRDPGHCCECQEHEETLKGKCPETIGLEELGNPGWDPVCFLSPEGFCYFFPAMVRLALEDKGETAYISSFLFHLAYDGPRNERFLYFSPAQRKFVQDFLLYLIDLYSPLFEEWPTLQGEFDNAIRSCTEE